MTTAAEFDSKYNILDITTPKNTPLAGIYKQSFAYYTLRERLPVIMTSVIDNLTKEKDEIAEIYGECVREELKTIVGHLSKFKYQLQTDKPLEILEDNEPDKEIWNTFISNLPADANSYFKTCWLYAECYMYRRMSSYFKLSESLKNYDCFAAQKRQSAIVSVPAMIAVARHVKCLPKDAATFMKLLKLNLWGNKCDLSMSAGKEVIPTTDPFAAIEHLETKLLVDGTPDVWSCMSVAADDAIVDIVCDNVGYELYTDLIIADYLIEHKMATKVRFYVKAIPWFISDVMCSDFHWTLKYLSEHTSDELKAVGARWTNFVESKKFVLMPTEYFWTSPYEFHRMKEINGALYEQLSKSHLVIIKGDLNYRKLLGDFNWDPTESFDTCLRGFLPTNLCSLRTVKADLICGLSAGVAEDLNAKDPQWMLSGEYGVIQFAALNKNQCP